MSPAVRTRFLFAGLVLGGLVAWLAPAGAQTRFLSMFDDVPLPPPLAERADASFSFPAGAGHIAETAAAGPADEGAVRAYYDAALPALGWSQEVDDAGGLAFVRGRERLTLAFARGSDGGLVVRYRIVARTASLALD
ncbi:MAG: hypothetical protein NW200_01820 [Hyphomonadaceae bacterium]|nr:hypothetical protein [Hyphomonadaceae bacterium]